MSVFWALVNNDLMLKKRKRSQFSVWTKFYLGIAIVIGLGGYTWSLLQGFIDLNALFSFIPFMIIIPFGVSLSIISSEWQQDTTGWWLSLPYSRGFLLGAKCTTSYLRFVLSMLIILVVGIALALEAIMIKPDLYTMQQLLGGLQLGILNAFWNILISPLPILLGVTLAIVKRSHWRPASPLFWLSFILIINLYFNRFLNFATENAPSGYPPLGISLKISSNDYLAAILVGFALSTLLFAISSYLLDRHVEV